MSQPTSTAREIDFVPLRYDQDSPDSPCYQIRTPSVWDRPKFAAACRRRGASLSPDSEDELEALKFVIKHYGGSRSQEFQSAMTAMTDNKSPQAVKAARPIFNDLCKLAYRVSPEYNEAVARYEEQRTTAYLVAAKMFVVGCRNTGFEYEADLAPNGVGCSDAFMGKIPNADLTDISEKVVTLMVVTSDQEKNSESSSSAQNSPKKQTNGEGSQGKSSKKATTKSKSLERGTNTTHAST
jgi:hypothetical protein